MTEKSKEIEKRILIALIEKDLNKKKLAEKLDITRQAVTMAITRRSTSGKVYEWIKNNLNIDLNENIEEETA